ncbi:protein kinase [Acidobacteriota bacterium]
MKKIEIKLPDTISEHLSEEAVNTIKNNIEVREFKAGERFIRQGDIGSKLFIIQEGICKVLVEKHDEVFEIASLQAGDIVGEMAIISGEPRLAHVDAETPVVALEMSREQFDVLCEKYPPLLDFLTNVVEQRLYSHIFKEERDIGRYSIQKLLSKGDSSIVYKGIHKVLNMPVTIKMLKHNMSMNRDFYNRFKEDAKTIVQLTHDNIVKVFDIVNLYRTIFIFREYLEGEVLANILKESGKPTLSRTVNILIQLCSGIEYSHNNELILQNVNPKNISVLPDGQVKLFNIGLAYPFKSIIKDISGRKDYMAPEQIAGREVDERTDIYSLGLIAFEMVTGQKAVGGDGTQDDVPAPRSLCPDLAAELDACIIKATRFDPNERFQKASDMKADLEKIAKTISDATREEELTMTVRYLQEHSEQIKPMIDSLGKDLRKRGADVSIQQRND